MSVNAFQMLAEWVKINFEYYGEPFIRLYKLLKRRNTMKKVILIIDGNEIEAQVNEEDLKLIEKEKEFGRQKENKPYFFFDGFLSLQSEFEKLVRFNEERYKTGNYFLTEKECADAARVVSLWFRMKRFADEHNERKFDFDNEKTRKFFISYDLGKEKLVFFPSVGIKSAFQIYFDSAETAQKAIDEFHDDLIWYFTEYGKDS